MPATLEPDTESSQNRSLTPTPVSPNTALKTRWDKLLKRFNNAYDLLKKEKEREDQASIDGPVTLLVCKYTEAQKIIVREVVRDFRALDIEEPVPSDPVNRKDIVALQATVEEIEPLAAKLKSLNSDTAISSGSDTENLS